MLGTSKLGSLYVELIGKVDKFQAAMGKAERTVTRIGSKFSTAGQRMSIGISAPLIAMATSSIKAASVFQQSMNTVQAAGAYTNKEMVELEKQALKLGATTQFSAKQAAQGMEAFAAAGFTASQVSEVMAGTLDLAAAGQLSVADAAAITATTLSQFNMKADEAGKVADVLAVAANAGNISVQGLADGLKYAGTTAGITGQSFEEMSAALSLLSNKGIPAADAGTDITAGFANLLKPTDTVLGALKSINVELSELQTADGKIKPLHQVLERLNAAGIKGKQVFEIFGKENAKSWAAMLNLGAPAMLELTEKLKLVNGESKTIAATLRQGLPGAIEATTGAIETMSIAIGQALTPAAARFLENVQVLAGKITELAMSFKNLSPETQDTILGFLGVVAAAGPLLVVFGSIMTALGVMISGIRFGVTAIGWLIGGVKGLILALGILLTPIGAVTAAIVALGALAYTIYENWGPFKQFFIDIWKAVENALVSAGTKLGEWADIALKKTTEVAQYFADMATKAIESARKMYEGIKQWLVDKFNVVVDGVKSGVDKIVGFFEYAYDQVVGNSSVPDLVEGVKKEFGKLDDVMVKPTSDATESVVDDFENMKDKGLEVAQALAGAFAQVAQALGLSADSASALGDIFSGLLTGQGSSPLGRLGAHIGGAGGILNSVFGLFNGGGFSEGSVPNPEGFYGPGGDPAGTGAGEASMPDYSGLIQGITNTISAGFSASDKNKANGDNSGTGTAAGTGIGTAAGYFIGGPAGALVGSQIGGFIGDLIGGLFKTGPQNPQTIARHAFANWIEDTFKKLGQVSFYDAKGILQNYRGDLFNFIEGNRDRFRPGMDNEGVGGPGSNWGDNYKEIAGESMGLFNGLGTAFKNLLGLTDAVSEQIGYLLATNLNGNIDNARMLVRQLGLTQEEVMNALFESARKGEISWEEYNIQVAGLTQAFGKGKEAFGAYSSAFQDLIDSGGDGFDAINAVMNIGVEAAEAKVKDLADLKNRLIAEGADPAYVQALFDAAAQRGIDTLDEWMNMSEQTAGAIVGDMYALNQSLADKWHEMSKVLDEMTEKMSTIPDEMEKRIKFSVEISDEDLEKIDKVQQATGTGSGAETEETGGTEARARVSTGSGVNNAARRMAQIRPSGSRARGEVTAGGMGGGGRGDIHVHAQGASPDVDAKVRRVIQENLPAIAEAAAGHVASRVMRGGGYRGNFT